MNLREAVHQVSTLRARKSEQAKLSLISVAVLPLIDVVAFELVEICDSTLAVAMQQPAHEQLAWWTSDPSRGIVYRKLAKKYTVQVPVELLCYTAGRTASPDGCMLARIRPCFGLIGGPFRRAWFLGENDLYEVWVRSH